MRVCLQTWAFRSYRLVQSPRTNSVANCCGCYRATPSTRVTLERSLFTAAALSRRPQPGPLLLALAQTLSRKRCGQVTPVSRFQKTRPANVALWADSCRPGSVAERLIGCTLPECTRTADLRPGTSGFYPGVAVRVR